MPQGDKTAPLHRARAGDILSEASAEPTMILLLPAITTVELAQPVWLLAGCAAALPPILALRARRQGRRAARWSVALQMLAILAAAAALAQPLVPLDGQANLPVLIFRDVSVSARHQREPPLPVPPAMVAERYDFAAGLSREGAPPDAAQTNLAPALRLAAGRAGRAIAAVFHTDGQFQDDWSSAAAALGQAGLPVFVVPMRSPPPDSRVLALDAARAPGGAVELTISVQSSAVDRRTLTVRRVSPAPAVLLTRELRLLGGEPVTLTVTDAAAPSARAAVYRADLSAGDAWRENDTISAVMLPVARRAALVAPPETVAALRGALGAGATAMNPAAAPTDVQDWMDYDAVVLIDSTGQCLNPGQREALAEYVRGGGGLVFVGAGPHGSPADRDDPLNRCAALLANPYERKALKVVVVLDGSGSMSDRAGGRRKFDLAAEATISLRRHLTPRDRLAVIAFSDQARLVYDSGDAPPDFSVLHEALRSVEPTGPTHVVPVLTLAAEQTVPADADRLVLLLSDLATQDRQFDADALAAALRRARLALAVVATGGEASADAPLARLAETMNAPLVRRADLAALAGVFAWFLRDARGDGLLAGPVRVEAVGLPFGADPRRLPPAGTILLCAAQPQAEVLALAADQPVLAQMQAGLGRVVSLAVPLDLPANAAWRDSPGAVALLAGAMRWVRRPAADGRFDVSLARQGRALRVEVVARESGAAMNALSLVARAAALSGGETVEIPLPQASPGQYAATFAPPPSDAVVEILHDGRAVWRGAAGESCGSEFTHLGADEVALTFLARRAGGRGVRAADLPGALEQLRLRQLTPVWPALLAVALALMLLEWATARLLREA